MHSCPYVSRWSPTKPDVPDDLVLHARNLRYDMGNMRDSAVLHLHLIAPAISLLRRGGARSIIAESLLVKHQLPIINRSCGRGPNLRTVNRVIGGLCAVLMRHGRGGRPLF